MARYRAAWRAGRPPLGAHRPGGEARRLLTQLQVEGFSRAAIARRLGHVWPTLQYGDRVTLRTVLTLRRLYRLVCRDDEEEDRAEDTDDHDAHARDHSRCA